MSIWVKRKQSSFKPAPEGLHVAVCCDVWEPWEEADKYHDGSMVTKTRIVWQLDLQDEEHGRRFEVSQIYRLSLHEQSNLYKHLSGWLGQLSVAQIQEFDLESLIGKCCQIQVVQAIKDDGRVFANVQTVVPLGRGMTAIRVADDYVRYKDRKRNGGGEDAPF